MTKKHDFLRQEQSRDKHPERDQVGSQSRNTAVVKNNPDQQQAHTGKASNDHNRMGNTEPTQTNQGRRTPESRNDRQSRLGGMQNQIEERRGGASSVRGPRGAR